MPDPGASGYAIRGDLWRGVRRQSSAAAGPVQVGFGFHEYAAPICYGARDMNTSAKMLPANAWKIEESLDLYQVEAWGKGYFSINAKGHVVIRPSMDASREIDLHEVVQGLKARDLHTPVVIRFSDILAHRLRHGYSERPRRRPPESAGSAGSPSRPIPF